MPASKRPAGNDPIPQPSGTRKKPRQDAASADYSSDVRKKLQSSNRTGQACDRCRMRKMRCDGRPDGCGPCQFNQTPCRTTDRMTGIANERGHVPRLEQRIRELDNHIRGLEGRLMSLGADVKPFAEGSAASAAPVLGWNKVREQNNRQDSEGEGYESSADENEAAYTPSQQGVSHTPTSDGTNRLPEFRDGLAGDNYLGVSSGNSFISSIRGTAMNVLGAEIDLADYMSPDMDEPDASTFGSEYPLNKSYRAFVQTAYNAGPKPGKVELPPENEGRTYAEWYFRVINPYLPILHKPSFVAMLANFYGQKDGFKPSPAEIVMMHMMFAIMNFQYASRNGQNASHHAGLNDLSNRHYHYALSFFPQLMSSHTLQDVQALTMISLHLRSFPKPGACWMVSATTLNLAIELGLHRSAKRWASTTPQRSILEIEMRKRIFWSIYTIHTIIGGRMGRPMALRHEDYDVEMPEAVDDELLTADGIDTSRSGKCGFLVGSQSFKAAMLFTDLYTNIYTVKRFPNTYVDAVHRLEKRIQDWYDQWPKELKAGDISKDEQGRVHAQYMHVANLELRLLLRHPSVSLTNAAEFNEENLTKSMDASKKMLKHVKIIQKYMSLDTNWQTGALYVLAISTTLYGHWQRVEQITEDGFATLKQDMSDWLSIIGDVSELLGSGKRLQDVVRIIVEKTLAYIGQHLRSKAAPVASPVVKRSSGPQSASGGISQIRYEQYKPPDGYLAYSNHTNGSINGANGHAYQPEMPYAPTATYSYVGPRNSLSGTQNAYAPTAYTGAESTTSTNPQATAAAATAFLYSNGSSASEGMYQAAMPLHMSWRDWTGNMMPNNTSPQEYISPASALLQLGNAQNGSGNLTTTTNLPVGTDLEAGQMWPLMIFEPGQPNV